MIVRDQIILDVYTKTSNEVFDQIVMEIYKLPRERFDSTVRTQVWTQVGFPTKSTIRNDFR